jgi:hypothetical protein
MQAMPQDSAGECRVVEVGKHYTAVVRVTAPLPQLPQAEQQGRAALAEVLPGLGLEAGPAFTRWRPPADGQLEMEIGVIVSAGFEPQGDVVPSELPSGRAAHSLLRGPFEGLGAAWGRLFGWCKEQELPLAGIHWQIYGPEPSDPTLQETELYALLADKGGAK